MWGYQQFPTNKGGADISLYVALFFPMMQIACGYLAIALGFDDDKSNDKWAYFFTVITLLGFVFDAGMDIYFRTNNVYTPMTFGVALVETLFIYTLGSEVGLSVALAALIVLLPYGIRQFIDFLRRIKTGGPTATVVRQQQRNQQRNQQKKKGRKENSSTNRNQSGPQQLKLRRDPGGREIHEALTRFEQQEGRRQ
jgi:hypothetical protein